MKYLFAIGLISLLAGCGDPMVIDGVKYDTYGLIDEEEKRNPNIEYELIAGNVVWSVLLVETVAMPIYFVGFSMFEPVGKASPNKVIGQIN